MKTYVITLSKKFMSKHPKAGKPTFFVYRFISHEKIHTIRANYALWEKRIKEVQECRAIISIRVWKDKPYRSPQIEIAKLSCIDNVGIQKIEFTTDLSECIIEGRHYNYCDIAKNDGLLPEDFLYWFKTSKIYKPFAIIHFTKFRY